MDLTNEEILTASSVNQSLFDTQGSSALEDYFLDKSVRGWCLTLTRYFMILHSDSYSASIKSYFCVSR